eukprot:Lithocolla_globosa_v1_NODE_2311_length_2055_cov_24.745500.p2 type:complete len:133 gc:universal NODE_2311_length_2055_cov_24.745500:1105-1503(+)
MCNNIFFCVSPLLIRSLTATFAVAVVHINNGRWRGVPFILKCGKGLNERKTEIRIQFHKNPSDLFPAAAHNELVISVQPNEAVYLKTMAKVPGLSSQLVNTELDLTYKHRLVFLFFCFLVVVFGDFSLPLPL